MAKLQIMEIFSLNLKVGSYFFNQRQCSETKIPVRTARIIFQHAELRLFSPSSTADISGTVMLPSERACGCL